MYLLGNKAWREISVFEDDYKSEEKREISPLDDDFVREGYRNDGYDD